jgi:ATP-dependent DNA helicase RecG
MEEIANEYLKTKNSSWDYYVDETQTFNDLSFEKVNRFVERIEKRSDKKFDDNPMQILQKYGLVRDDKITFGAYLLFVKDFCLISGVQAGRFKTPTDIIDTISLNTDIFTEIDELIIFLRKHLMVEYIITGKPEREERYDYPLDAIREVVLNMIVHRDYRDSSDSIIKIFDDRIEFYNPGDLYDGLTVEQLESNNYKSKTRNKLMALMFKECGLIEKYGSGIGRIKKLCREHGIVEPKFEELVHGFKVTLFKEKLDGGVNGGVNSNIDPLYLFIKTNPNQNASTISKALQISLRTIQRKLKQLKDEEKIEFKGSPKTGGYCVK